MEYDQTCENIIRRVEYHRNAVALMPEPADKRPGVAFLLQRSVEESYCTCSKRKTRICPHLKTLFGTSKVQLTAAKLKAFQDCFKRSLWYDLAWLLAEGQRLEADSVSLGYFEKNDQKILCVSDRNDDTIVSYLSDEADQYRFAERIGAFPSKRGSKIPDRATILQRLKLWTLSDAEGLLNDRGLKSRRQAFEDSFWHRLGYHCFREFEAQRCTFSPSINEETGDFVVSCKNDSGKAIFHLVVPLKSVRPLLKTFKKRLPNQHHMPIHPVPLKSIFKISQNTELDLDIRPMVQMIQKSGKD